MFKFRKAVSPDTPIIVLLLNTTSMCEIGWGRLAQIAGIFGTPSNQKGSLGAYVTNSDPVLPSRPLTHPQHRVGVKTKSETRAGAPCGWGGNRGGGPGPLESGSLSSIMDDKWDGGGAADGGTSVSSSVVP